MSLLILGTQLFPVPRGRRWGRRRRLAQGSQGIDVKVSIVGVLFLKVVARFYFRISLRQDRLQFGDDLLQLLARKFAAKPDDKSCYSSHGGWSPGCRQTTFRCVSEEATIPPFVFPLKPATSPRPASAELWKLPRCGNHGKTKQQFFHRSHIAWKTPRKKRSGFPTVPTAPAAGNLFRKNRGLRGETAQMTVTHLRMNQLAA